MEQLLDHEPRAAEQVPLLLQMKEEKIALVKAIDSGDTDLGAHPSRLGYEVELIKQCTKSCYICGRHCHQATSSMFWTILLRRISHPQSSYFRSTHARVIDSY